MHKYLKESYVSGTTIVCNAPDVTDPTVLANRPDTALRAKKEKACLLINIVLTDDPNVNTEETNKLTKCKDLENAVSRMWKARTKIVLVIIAALGTIKKGSDQNRQLLPGHRSATELQKVTQHW